LRKEVKVLANPVRKATFRANINDVITDIMVKTSSDNVVINKQGDLLSDYLVNVVLSDDMDNALRELKSDILDGAPEAYDTLKEIADYINSHGDDASQIIAILSTKADKSEVDVIADSLQQLSQSLSRVPIIYYSKTQPANLKVGDMWVQPVSGADALSALRNE
jgi:hypothetical protein